MAICKAVCMLSASLLLIGTVAATGAHVMITQLSSDFEVVVQNPDSYEWAAEPDGTWQDAGTIVLSPQPHDASCFLYMTVTPGTNTITIYSSGGTTQTCTVTEDATSGEEVPEWECYMSSKFPESCN